MKTTVEKAESQNGTLSFAQIKDIVGNGWAVIKDPVFNGCIFLKGELIYHSHDEDEAFEAMKAKRKEHRLYIKYCGKRDPNIVYLL